jgi:hypothetical protein
MSCSLIFGTMAHSQDVFLAPMRKRLTESFTIRTLVTVKDSPERTRIQECTLRTSESEYFQ